MLVTSKVYELTAYNPPTELFICDECEIDKMFEQFAHEVYMEMSLQPMSYRWVKQMDNGYSTDFVDETTGRIWKVYCIDNDFYLEQTDEWEEDNY